VGQPFWGPLLKQNNLLLNVKKHKFLFQLLDVIKYLRASWFKTQEHLISYNNSHWPGKKKENALLKALLHGLFEAT